MNNSFQYFSYLNFNLNTVYNENLNCKLKYLLIFINIYYYNIL